MELRRRRAYKQENQCQWRTGYYRREYKKAYSSFRSTGRGNGATGVHRAFSDGYQGASIEHSPSSILKWTPQREAGTEEHGVQLCPGVHSEHSLMDTRVGPIEHSQMDPTEGSREEGAQGPTERERFHRHADPASGEMSLGAIPSSSGCLRRRSQRTQRFPARMTQTITWTTTWTSLPPPSPRPCSPPRLLPLSLNLCLLFPVAPSSLPPSPFVSGF